MYSPNLDPLDLIRPLQGLPPAQLGNSKRICVNEMVDIISPHNSCQQAEMIGVTLGIEDDEAFKFSNDPERGGTVALVRAVIQWGIGGINFHAELDFLNGTQLCLLMENCVIAARYDAASLDGHCDPCCLPRQRVSAAVGYGCVGRGSNPARLTEVACVKPGGRCRIPIPPFATSFTVLPIQASRVAVDIVPCGLPMAVRDVIRPLSNADQNNTIDQIPLFNGARFVDVISRQEEGVAAAYVVFGLAL